MAKAQPSRFYNRLNYCLAGCVEEDLGLAEPACPRLGSGQSPPTLPRSSSL